MNIRDIPVIEIGIPCGRNSERYFEFFARTAIASANFPEKLRFIVNANNGANANCFREMAGKWPVEVIESDTVALSTVPENMRRSFSHGIVLNDLLVEFQNPVGMLCDCDVAMLAKGWDELLVGLLSEKVAIVGSGYPSEDLKGGPFPKFRNFPNVCACIFRVDILEKCEISLMPQGVVQITDAESAALFGRSVGETIHLDVGYELPQKLQRAGYRGITLEWVWGGSRAARALSLLPIMSEAPLVMWPHEFQYDQRPILAHLGKSEIRPFDSDVVAQQWVKDVSAFLVSQGIGS